MLNPIEKLCKVFALRTLIRYQLLFKTQILSQGCGKITVLFDFLKAMMNERP